MTKFNPENKETLTYGECLSPAMKITDPEDAKQYLDAYVKYITKYFTDAPYNEKGQTPLQVAKSNLGYFAGYCSDETRERVERLFCCSHPIFGSIKEKGSPTSEQALQAGLNYSKT
jgi:hypothetical protein